MLDSKNKFSISVMIILTALAMVSQIELTKTAIIVVLAGSFIIVLFILLKPTDINSQPKVREEADLVIILKEMASVYTQRASLKSERQRVLEIYKNFDEDSLFSKWLSLYRRVEEFLSEIGTFKQLYDRNDVTEQQFSYELFSYYTESDDPLTHATVACRNFLPVALQAALKMGPWKDYNVKLDKFIYKPDPENSQKTTCDDTELQEMKNKNIATGEELITLLKFLIQKIKEMRKKHPGLNEIIIHQALDLLELKGNMNYEALKINLIKTKQDCPDVVHLEDELQDTISEITGKSADEILIDNKTYKD